MWEHVEKKTIRHLRPGVWLSASSAPSENKLSMQFMICFGA